MRLEEIRKKAREYGLRPQGLKKDEIIRSIQETEKNIPCYGTERVEYCNETHCLWHGDCVKERGTRTGHS